VKRETRVLLNCVAGANGLRTGGGPLLAWRVPGLCCSGDCDVEVLWWNQTPAGLVRPVASAAALG